MHFTRWQVDLFELMISVIAADGLYKRDVFSKLCTRWEYIGGDMLTVFVGFPDPFAVATIGGEQTRTTSVIKKTLNPYWNESFDMLGSSPLLYPHSHG